MGGGGGGGGAGFGDVSWMNSQRSMSSISSLVLTQKVKGYKRSIIGQLNVPAATAENEEQQTMSNIIYTGFQNTFLWSFLD